MITKDKVALVTGSTRGIGKAIAERLLRENAIVYFNSCYSQNNGSQLQLDFEDKGLRAFYVNGDVSSERDVRRIFETIMSEQGKLDILVNNAGVYRDDGLNIDDYSAIHMINGYGVFLCSSLAAEIINRGKIVNISSIYGLQPDPDSILASGVKAEVEAYTKAFAKNLKGKIEVNSVAHGYTDTLLLKESLTTEVIDEMIGKTPLKRLIKPDEIADTVLFLIGNDGITGQTIIVDGGHTL